MEASRMFYCMINCAWKSASKTRARDRGGSMLGVKNFQTCKQGICRDSTTSAAVNHIFSVITSQPTSQAPQQKAPAVMSEPIRNKRSDLPIAPCVSHNINLQTWQSRQTRLTRFFQPVHRKTHQQTMHPFPRGLSSPVLLASKKVRGTAIFTSTFP